MEEENESDKGNTQRVQNPLFSEDFVETNDNMVKSVWSNNNIESEDKLKTTSKSI